MFTLSKSQQNHIRLYPLELMVVDKNRGEQNPQKSIEAARFGATVRQTLNG